MYFRNFFTLLLAGFAFALAACSKAPVAETGLAPKVSGERIVFPDGSLQRTALTVVTVEPQPPEMHRMNGRLTWNEDETVRIYSPVTGRVQSVSVTLGEQVAKDAALARLASPDFGQAQADYHKSEADLLLAEHNLSRTKDLFDHGALARKDLEGAENGFASAESERQRALARLALYRASLDGIVDGAFVLRTPQAGVVVEKNINAGQEVRPDQMLANVPQLAAPLFVVSNPAQLSVMLDATERDLAVLRPGQQFIIRTQSSPEYTFEGRVDWIADALDSATRRIPVRGRVDNSRRLLKAEMFVTVEFESVATPGLVVPAVAVIMKAARYFVFVEEKPGSFVRREVDVGAEQEGKICVRHGLDAGQRVVTDGSVLLEELHGGS